MWSGSELAESDFVRATSIAISFVTPPHVHTDNGVEVRSSSWDDR